jgi:hypothetical protein
MPNTKSKLGQNPLPPRGVAALFPVEAPSTAENHDPAPVTKSSRRTTHQATKSVSHLVNKVTAPSTADSVFERHTFYLTEPQGQKVKLYALLHRMQISEVIRMLIDDHLKIQP